MATIFVPAPMREMLDGATSVDIPGVGTVLEAIEALDRTFPGVRKRLLEQDGDRWLLRRGLQVAVDGAMSAQGLRQSVADTSEIHFLPAIGGG